MIEIPYEDTVLSGYSYRSPVAVAKDPDIDTDRIALMGLSFGADQHPDGILCIGVRKVV